MSAKNLQKVDSKYSSNQACN